MKLLTIYPATMFLCLSFVCVAQKFPENRITLTFDNDSLYQVLRKIGQTQPDNWLNFSYSSDRMKQSLPVTIKLEKATLTEALENVLEGQPIYKGFQIIEYDSFRVVQLSAEENTGNYYFDKSRQATNVYHIGDKLLNIPFPIQNYSSRFVMPGDFKGKLLILDMWGVNCSGCIAAIPKMEQLQAKFKDKVQIILVTKDSQVMVDELKARSTIVRETTLPIVTGGASLPFMFDYKGVPIYYWIDEAGSVKYVSRSVSAAHVEDYLASKTLSFAEKIDTVINISYDRPMAVGLNGIQGGNFGISSYLAPHDNSKYEYRQSLMGSYSISDTASIKSYGRAGCSIYDLYKFVFRKTENVRSSKDKFFPNSHVLLEMEDSDRYSPRLDDGKENLFDYQLIVKKNVSSGQFCDLMKRELDIYFGLSSSLRMRKVPCYVINRKEDTDKLVSKPGAPEFYFKSEHYIAHNLPWWKVILNLNVERTDQVQIIDETGLDPNTIVSLKMDIALDRDLITVNKSLAPYGLFIEKTVRETEVIVLEDAKNP